MLYGYDPYYYMDRYIPNDSGIFSAAAATAAAAAATGADTGAVAAAAVE